MAEFVTIATWPFGQTAVKEAAALLQQGKTIAYVGHAGPLRLSAHNAPTSAREILGYFNNDYLGQATYQDYPIGSS